MQLLTFIFVSPAGDVQRTVPQTIVPRVGERVTVGDHSGTVASISYRFERISVRITVVVQA